MKKIISMYAFFAMFIHGSSAMDPVNLGDGKKMLEVRFPITVNISVPNGGDIIAYEENDIETYIKKLNISDQIDAKACSDLSKMIDEKIQKISDIMTMIL